MDPTYFSLQISRYSIFLSLWLLLLEGTGFDLDLCDMLHFVIIAAYIKINRFNEMFSDEGRSRKPAGFMWYFGKYFLSQQRDFKITMYQDSDHTIFMYPIYLLEGIICTWRLTEMFWAPLKAVVVLITGWPPLPEFPVFPFLLLFLPP